MSAKMLSQLATQKTLRYRNLQQSGPQRALQRLQWMVRDRKLNSQYLMKRRLGRLMRWTPVKRLRNLLRRTARTEALSVWKLRKVRLLHCALLGRISVGFS